MKSKSVFNIQMPRANAKQMTNTIPHYVENVLTEKSGDWQKKERKKKKKKTESPNKWRSNDGKNQNFAHWQTTQLIDIESNNDQT